MHQLFSPMGLNFVDHVVCLKALLVAGHVGRERSSEDGNTSVPNLPA
jgi:hypothetical protein